MPKATLLVLLIAGAVPASAAADGKTVYSQTCAACHATGLGGAPKLNDRVGWAPRLAGGTRALTVAVIKGKGAMPPKAGNPSLSETEIQAAIEYMVTQVNRGPP